MTGRTSILLLLTGFLTGLFLRIALAFDMGVVDMNEYFRWGQQALQIGLPHSYHNIYFPLQYHLFEVFAFIVTVSGLKFFIVYKLANLPFDIGCFLLVVALLKRRNSNPLYALLYWLHPWFLTFFSLGYCDFQFAFFILLSIWLLRHDTVGDYLLAGFYKTQCTNNAFIANDGVIHYHCIHTYQTIMANSCAVDDSAMANVSALF